MPQIHRSTHHRLDTLASQMRNKHQQTVILLFALFLLIPGALLAAPPAPPPPIAASGYLLMDMHSRQIIAADNAETRLEPASLTKILTAHVVFDEIRQGHIDLADEVIISEKAWRMEGSRMFLEVNTRATVEQLLKGLIIQSGNDAAVALAEHTAGSEEAFAALMNEHARQLGMNNSHFVNASGLPDPDHYTTPHDIALVTAATIREFPEWYAWYAIKEYAYNDITQPNRNRLLWRDSSVDGVKTGHTEAAGYCLVASASREQMRLISVVMGTESEEARATETQELLGYGFRFFETRRLYRAEQPIQNIRVWKGASDQLPVGASDEIAVTVPRGETGAIAAKLLLGANVEAPVTHGQKIGTIEITHGDKVLMRTPAIALADIPLGGLFGQLMDSVLLMFE